MLELREVPIGGHGPPRAALAICPAQASILGLDALKRFQLGRPPSGIDRSIVGAATKASERVCITIITTKCEGERRWGFDPELSTEDAERLALALLRAQLPTYRRLLAVGIAMHVLVEATVAERAAFGAARRELGRELAQFDDDATRLDRWVLAHFLSHSIDSLEAFIGRLIAGDREVLERQLRDAERRRALLPEPLRKMGRPER